MQLGVIGLGTMGANLARNAARNGATVAVYNRTTEKTSTFLKAHGKEGKFVACKTIEALCKALKPPRPILLMVKAGEAVDQMIRELRPYLDEGDIIIDAGNSHYRHTALREAALKEEGFRFVGMGVSGGEEGALLGPSIMPGGEKAAYERLRPLLERMAAKDMEKGRCVTYLGPASAGHFVKMVHNGIEYGIMQLIAEAYDLLKTEGFDNKDLGRTFKSWNAKGDLQSFLMEITAEIFKAKDPETGDDLIDMIKDSAGQKGTGKWTTEAAMGYGVAIPTINAAVDARIISGALDCRPGWREMPDAHMNPGKTKGADSDVKTALALSILIAYIQGFHLLAYASEAEQWNLNLEEIGRIWEGGCIIRSAMLPTLRKSYGRDKAAEKALVDVRKRFAGEAQKSWRRAVARGVGLGVPLPAMTASLGYFDAMRRENLPQNLIQAQRDFFGAHTYERTDKPGIFHTDWKLAVKA